jgi:putative peptide zinc metalloprotease protein
VLWPVALRTGITNETSLLRCGFLVGYAIASGVYRIAVFALIMWMLLSVGDKFEIGGIVGLLVLLMSSGYLFRRASAFFSFPKPVRRSPRPSVVIGVVAFLMIAIGLMPLPRRVTAPLSIRPTDAQQVFATLPGHIAWAVNSGAMLEEGQLIARLRNLDIERELVVIQSECERLKIELEGLQQSRVADQDAAKRIPLLQKSLEEALKRQALRQQAAAKLLIYATQPGRLFPPPELRAKNSNDHEVVAWQGTPLEPQNRGAWLKAGTLLGLVGHEAAREAIVFLKQQDVELIREDQIVTVRLADRESGLVTGSVVEVAISPSELIPEELTATGLLPKELELDGEPLYQVRVKLANEGSSLPIRLVAAATIEVAPASLFDRIGRFLGDAFRI